MHLDADGYLAIEHLEVIWKKDEHGSYFVLDQLVSKRGMQWLVDAAREHHPNMSAVSIPITLARCAVLTEPEDPICLQGQTWEGVKASIQKAVRDYLR
jgi:hypothetical protein